MEKWVVPIIFFFYSMSSLMFIWWQDGQSINITRKYWSWIRKIILVGGFLSLIMSVLTIIIKKYICTQCFEIEINQLFIGMLILIPGILLTLLLVSKNRSNPRIIILIAPIGIYVSIIGAFIMSSIMIGEPLNINHFLVSLIVLFMIILIIVPIFIISTPK